MNLKYKLAVFLSLIVILFPAVAGAGLTTKDGTVPKHIDVGPNSEDWILAEHGVVVVVNLTRGFKAGILITLKKPTKDVRKTFFEKDPAITGAQLLKTVKVTSVKRIDLEDGIEKVFVVFYDTSGEVIWICKQSINQW